MTKKTSAEAMPVLRTDVAGADLGSREHWVAAPPGADGKPNVRTFGTTTKELHAMADWLLQQGVHSVAMQSTGIYWVPLFELLQHRAIEPVLVNARHLKGVPGHKSDMIDCQWIQRLHSCGLLRGSFHPDEAITALRALHRQQANLIDARTRAVQWMQKSLDQMNVQIHRAVTDLTGKTGMAIVRAIVDGERDPLKLAQLRDGRCGTSVERIAEHLTGSWHAEHLFNLARALEHYEHLQEQIARYDVELTVQIQALQPPERAEFQLADHPNPTKHRAMRRHHELPLRQDLWRFAGVDLTRIDAISPAAARIILTEVGLDLSAFPSEKHFVSWLRLCPRVAMSGGKPVKKRRNGAGANRIAGLLRVTALSLVRSKTALGALYRRVAFRKGGRVALLATARQLAILVYRALRFGHQYVDVGQDAYNHRFEQRRLRSLHASAKELGYQLLPISQSP